MNVPSMVHFSPVVALSTVCPVWPSPTFGTCFINNTAFPSYDHILSPFLQNSNQSFLATNNEVWIDRCGPAKIEVEYSTNAGLFAESSQLDHPGTYTIFKIDICLHFNLAFPSVAFASEAVLKVPTKTTLYSLFLAIVAYLRNQILPTASIEGTTLHYNFTLMTVTCGSSTLLA